MPTQKEPFVPQEDRAEVKLPSLDQPISELKVRDLQAILAGNVIKKFEKFEHKELKPEKFEHKELKLEKIEIKEVKHEKFEHKDIWIENIPKQVFEPGPDPTQIDPVIRNTLNQVIQTLGGLTKRVDELANQVADLQKKK